MPAYTFPRQITTSSPSGDFVSTSCGAPDFWPYWATTTSTAAIIDPWPVWAGGPGPVSITASTDSWRYWTQVIDVSTNGFAEALEHGQRRLRDPEFDRQLREQEAAHRRQREADHRTHVIRMGQVREKREAAAKRAETLLMTLLSSEQQAQYQAERRFVVHLPNGHSYRLKKGRHGNLERIDERGYLIENLCVHVAPHEVPDCDNMAAQKLMLETCEDELRAIANITGYQRIA